MSNPFPTLESIHTVVFDFDGVFTDNKVYVDQNGLESIRCDRGDGLAFDFVRRYRSTGKINVEFFILSKEANSVVPARAKKLKIPCFQAIGDKLSFMKDYFTNHYPNDPNPFSRMIFLGNDLNDLPLIRKAGYSVVPSDAHPMVKSAATCVMNQRGGDGFVRAFIEKLLRITTMSVEEIEELISQC